ncbi:hypothetical protein HMPREF3227_01895, partial [Corynebacterium sp. CMW7794]
QNQCTLKPEEPLKTDAVGEMVPGLIPAHAGSTSKPRSSKPRAGAHPRSRGEHR